MAISSLTRTSIDLYWKLLRGLAFKPSERTALKQDFNLLRKFSKPKCGHQFAAHGNRQGRDTWDLIAQDARLPACQADAVQTYSSCAAASSRKPAAAGMSAKLENQIEHRLFS